jgi:hypothetical protein
MCSCYKIWNVSVAPPSQTAKNSTPQAQKSPSFFSLFDMWLTDWDTHFQDFSRLLGTGTAVGKKKIWEERHSCVMRESMQKCGNFTVIAGNLEGLDSDGGSTSNVLMLMLYWSEKMTPNTRLIDKTSNRLTLITVFCFRVDPPSLLWHHIWNPGIYDFISESTYGIVFVNKIYIAWWSKQRWLYLNIAELA